VIALSTKFVKLIRISFDVQIDCVRKHLLGQKCRYQAIVRNTGGFGETENCAPGQFHHALVQDLEGLLFVHLCLADEPLQQEQRIKLSHDFLRT